MKTKTLAQVEAMKAKAVRFCHDVLKDSERGEEIEAESPERYAERKRIQIENPPWVEIRLRGAKRMAKVLTEVEELQDTMSEVEEILESALDPALERAEIIAKIDEALDLLTEDEDESEE